MSTDRELLELAAKAAGFDFIQWTAGTWTFGQETQCRPDGGDVWNPLEDDGDALRLAAKLEIDIEFHVNVEAIAWFRMANGEQRHVTKEHGLSMEATRRAIVRAAAEIGRNMMKEIGS